LVVVVISLGGGRPRSHGLHLVERAATPDDFFAGNNPAQSPLMPVGVREPARLIAWRGPEGERIMVGGIGINDLPRPCCLTLWWVKLDRSGTTELELIQDTLSSSAHVLALDMDADGTDELAVVETADPNLPDDTRVLVLRWNGSQFDRIESRARRVSISGPPVVLGDSDGLPGDEFGFVARPVAGVAAGPSVHRFRLRGDRLVEERAELSTLGTVVGIPGPEGGRLALVNAAETFLLAWPAGREATIPASSFRGGDPLGVVGRDDAARLLIQRAGAVDVLDAALVSRQSFSRGTAASWFRSTSLPPYAGELPGGDESGSAAMIFSGQLFTAPEDALVGRVRPIAALPGRAPIGLLGPGRGWAAVADGVTLPVGRRGGSLGVVAEARAAAIAIVPTDVLMRPEADGGVLEPEINGAIVDGSRAARPILLTSGGATARFTAPVGSVIHVRGIAGDPDPITVGQSGTAEAVIVPVQEGSDDENLTVRLLVATPAGHGYAATWEARVMRRPPGLTASAPFASLSFSVPLSGRTSPTARLLVDGEPVSLGADGTFVAEVSAGPLPRTVRLTATDLVGNTTEITVSVVGVLDYRQLPWIPIVAGLTLVAGGVLFLRVPKPSATPGGDPDQGVLEELE
jgi:hypothetical protein